MQSQNPEARLLVVDDEPNIRELLSTSLRFAGFEVRAAANGHDALEAAEEFQQALRNLDAYTGDYSECADAIFLAQQNQASGTKTGGSKTGGGTAGGSTSTTFNLILADAPLAAAAANNPGTLAVTGTHAQGQTVTASAPPTPAANAATVPRSTFVYGSRRVNVVSATTACWRWGTSVVPHASSTRAHSRRAARSSAIVGNCSAVTA